MRCRPDLPVFVSACVLMTLSIIALFLPMIIPLGIGGWLLSIAAIKYGVPLSLALAMLAAAIFYVSEWRTRRRRDSNVKRQSCD